MNFRTMEMNNEESFQITPMIDIIFLLLIFFLVNSVLQVNEREVSIVLPKTGKSSETVKTNNRTIFINVDNDGMVKLYGQKICKFENLDGSSLQKAKEKLIAKLMDMKKMNDHDTIIINGDKGTILQYVIHVLNCCTSAGFSNVSFMTEVSG